MAIECDVLIIGGGPAGSTAAATLAGRGHDVVLLEKARHPRFHVGESLLPLNTAIFDRLEITDQVAAMGVHKPGAEFVLDRTGQAVQFSFADGLDPRFTSSWQVERAGFDEMLFRTAAERGARTEEGVTVTGATFGGARAKVEARDEAGVVHDYAPRFVLDASGRETFLGGRVRRRDTNKRSNTAATFAHFQGVERRAGELDGYISIHLAEDGWFWMIPLPDDVMSVGFVGSPAAFKRRRGLLEQIAATPTVAARMRGAVQVREVSGAGNYSYYCDQSHGEGYLMIGDAFAFLDPIFSSGVFLAMTSGEMGAAVAEAWLVDPARGRKAAARMEREVRHAMDRLAWLVHRINEPALRMLFMAPRNWFGMRRGLVSLLAGSLRGSRDQIVPVLAFKSIYYLTVGMLRIGLVKPPRPAASAAE